LLRAHKEILYFASPFFEAILSGDWAETAGRPMSMSSVITISQPPAIPGELMGTIPDMTVTSVPEVEEDVDTVSLNEEDRAKAIAGSLSKLEKSAIVGSPPTDSTLPASDESASSGSISSSNTSPVRERKPSLEVPKAGPSGRQKKKQRQGAAAVIILKEERVSLSHHLRTLSNQMRRHKRFKTS
jgi:hypothetical protein